MEDTKEQLTQKVRDWLIAVTGLPAKRVIPVDDDGTRRKLPYLTVSISASDTEEGTDEVHYSYNDATDELEVLVSMDRHATASINGYGRVAGELINRAARSLSKPSGHRLLSELKLSIEPLNDTQEISQTVEPAREKRFVRDFRVHYRLLVDDEPTPYLARFEAQVTTTMEKP